MKYVYDVVQSLRLLTKARGKNPSAVARHVKPRGVILSCARVHVFNFYQMEISTKRENCYLEDTSRGRKDTLPGTDYAAGSRGGSWKEVFPSRRPPTPVT